jgi:hypothetical protein
MMSTTWQSSRDCYTEDDIGVPEGRRRCRCRASQQYSGQIARSADQYLAESAFPPGGIVMMRELSTQLQVQHRRRPTVPHARADRRRPLVVPRQQASISDACAAQPVWTPGCCSRSAAYPVDDVSWATADYCSRRWPPPWILPADAVQ